MRNIFLDVNILVDLISERTPLEDRLRLIKEINLGSVYISSLSVHIAIYILKMKPNTIEMDSMKEFCSMLNIIPLTNVPIHQAFEIGYKDFEDMLQFFSAVEFCDTILTRDKKDFENIKRLTKSKINIISPTK